MAFGLSHIQLLQIVIHILLRLKRNFDLPQPNESEVRRIPVTQVRHMSTIPPSASFEV